MGLHAEVQMQRGLAHTVPWAFGDCAGVGYHSADSVRLHA